MKGKYIGSVVQSPASYLTGVARLRGRMEPGSRQLENCEPEMKAFSPMNESLMQNRSDLQSAAIARPNLSLQL